MLKLQNAITYLIQSHFVKKGDKNQINPILIGKLEYKVHPSKLVVRIPYFMNKMDTTEFSSLQGVVLAQKLTELDQNYIIGIKNYNIELRFIRIQYPFLESFILSQYIAINAGKYNFNRMQKMLFRGVIPGTVSSDHISLTSSVISMYNITGVKMELAGRLITQRSIPRKTVSNAHIGSFNVNKKEFGINKDQYVSKNKMGSFTIKVWIGRKRS